MPKKKKQNRGGQRENAGRSLKYGEETKNISFRCPMSKIPELREYVNLKLSEWSQGGI